MIRSRGVTCVAAMLVGLGAGVRAVHAQKPGKPFKSPLKNFTIIAPRIPYGTKIQKENSKDDGTVSFFGDAGDLRRIDYFRAPAGKTAPMDSTEQQALYHRSLNALLKSNTGSSLLSERAYTLDGTGMLLALVAFPEGSTVVESFTGKREDSVRGILIFARKDFLYALHAELLDNVLERKKDPLPPEELLRRAELYLPELYRSMTFH